jgi:hypothetical protein
MARTLFSCGHIPIDKGHAQTARVRQLGSASDLAIFPPGPLHHGEQVGRQLDIRAVPRPCRSDRGGHDVPCGTATWPTSCGHAATMPRCERRRSAASSDEQSILTEHNGHPPCTNSCGSSSAAHDLTSASSPLSLRMPGCRSSGRS